MLQNEAGINMQRKTSQALRLPGIALLLASVLSAILMFGHPTGDDAPSVMRGVHGLLLLLSLVILAALGLLIRPFGLGLVTAIAFTAFATGTIGNMLAGLINGFVTPAILGTPELSDPSQLVRLAWEMNQIFASAGVVSTGIAIGTLAASLFQCGLRVLGLAGIVVGLGTAGALTAGFIDLDLGEAIIVYGSQLLWLALFGLIAALSDGFQRMASSA